MVQTMNSIEQQNATLTGSISNSVAGILPTGASTTPPFPTEYPPTTSTPPPTPYPKANEKWTRPISFQQGFKHPEPIFPLGKGSRIGQNDQNRQNGPNFVDNGQNGDPKTWKYIPQGNELIRALMASTDSPAFPIITPLSATVMNPDGTIQPKMDQGKGESQQQQPKQDAAGSNTTSQQPSHSHNNNTSSPTQTPHQHHTPSHTTIETLSPALQSLHQTQTTSLRRRNDLMVGILNAIGETVATGDLAGVTMTNLKSLSQQMDSYKLLKTQEFVRIMVRRDAHEFSSLHLCDNMLWDHPSRAYVSAFEECLGNDTITVSSYSSPLGLHGMFGLQKTAATAATAATATTTGITGTTSTTATTPTPQSSSSTASTTPTPAPSTTTTTTSPTPIEKLLIPQDQVKPIVIGVKIHSDYIFQHTANSLRSLIPSLSSTTAAALPPQLERTINDFQEHFEKIGKQQQQQQQQFSQSSSSQSQPSTISQNNIPQIPSPTETAKNAV